MTERMGNRVKRREKRGKKSELAIATEECLSLSSFEGDGSAEAVYADEDFLRIYRGNGNDDGKEREGKEREEDIKGDRPIMLTLGYMSTSARLSAYYLYLPTFTRSGGRALKVRAKVNGIPLKVIVGGRKRGRLFGIGVHKGRERQLFRMDWHDPDRDVNDLSNYGGNELAFWYEGNFVYHVLKWGH